MRTKTFPARVTNGQLQYQEPLDAFEGQQVHVTLTAPDASVPFQEEAPEVSVEEPPEEMDIEKDLYVPMPLPGETLSSVRVIEGGSLPPCIVIPEELPDE